MNKIIWSAWLQGRDKAPVPVEACLASWQEKNPGWTLRCLDLGSVERYVPLRPHLDLARQIVTAASFSDVLRMLLLREYGGVWVDATLLCVKPLDAWLPQLMPDGFFAFATPAKDRPLASWFIAAEEDNMLLSRWCQRALDYWAERTRTDDYFWLHHLFAQMCDTDAVAAQAWMRVPKVSARGALQLLPDRMLQPHQDVAASVDWSVPVIKLTHRLPTSSALRGTLIERLVARTTPDRPGSASASAAVCTASASAAPKTFASLKVSTENLGDHIQIIAGLQLLDRFAIKPSRFIDRDDEIGSAPGLADVEAPVGILLNGWFKFNGAEWPPHWKLAPVFYGTHLRPLQCPELVSERSLVFFRQHGPIGCRDVCTEQLLRAHGVEAFTSNCLSLTLRRRMPRPDQQTEIFVVSKDEGIREFLPKDLNYRFISHYTGGRDFAANMRRADALLHEYSTRARLIVTTLLHCALPAIAMGIPVVVFYPINHDFGRASDHERFSSLEKLTRIYRLDEMDEVDWSPQPLSVGALKLSILEGLYAAAAERWRLAPAAPLGPIAPPDALPDPTESMHSENQPKQPEMKREIDAVQPAIDRGAPASPRRPQAMLVLALERFTALASGSIASLAAEVFDIERRKGSRKATDFLLDKIGMRCSTDLDESYFTEAMHYHLALVYAHSGQPHEMAEQFRLSRTMPADEGDLILSDHINLSFVLKARQLAAVRRGVPPILIACMPRSASATFTYTLAGALDIPVMHVSAGNFPNRFLVPSWFNMFLEGGAITQDHFGANDFNVGVLESHGLRDVFVLIRDPRAAARSLAHYLGSAGSGAPLVQRIERQCIDNFIPWLQGWMECAAAPNRSFCIHWITYAEVCRDPDRILRRIRSILGTNHTSSTALDANYPLEEQRRHFVEGDDRAWTREVDALTREAMWQACTPQIRSLLNLEW